MHTVQSQAIMQALYGCEVQLLGFPAKFSTAHECHNTGQIVGEQVSER